ncbi:hypothetical protein SAMN04488503_0233 [Humidesulfovibrio mexicanus]|uniref:Uncharacterized protein n=1 Tax=Humidesulfovibrio mexicanus TaxID=147047 RepID=A0A238XLG7_9BACT|nr:hypothetical protein [Humidesulfovibrio mexicanus]SNR59522.1 hypothetical protein SAMN04488503_0233 [Humidesulfovibrio mexicanus]
MDLKKEFEGMLEKLRAHVEPAIVAPRARLADCEAKLARLKGHEKDIAARLEKLPREKESLLSQISRGMAAGEDVGQLRRKIKDTESEFAELKDIEGVLRREGLPRANGDCESAKAVLRDAVREAVREVRAEYVNSARGFFAELAAADEQWRAALIAVLHEVGSVSSREFSGEDYLVPYPLSHQLRVQSDDFK